jgi:hypothetical protein
LRPQWSARYPIPVADKAPNPNPVAKSAASIDWDSR